MHPPLSTTISNNNTIRLSQEHRARLYQILNELNDDQLRLFLTNHLQSISNTSLNNQFQHHSRTQLLQQSYILIDNNYSVDMEQALYGMRQKQYSTNYQQEHLYRTQQQNYNTGYNQQAYYFTPQTTQYNGQPNYRYSAPSTSSSNIAQQFRQSNGIEDRFELFL
jgi:hypothetical protein